MKKVSSKDIRQQSIINLSLQGVPLQSIANELDVNYAVVERAIKSERGQSQLQKTLSEMELSINSKLPQLLELSLDHLLDIMTKPKGDLGFHGYERKTKAAAMILSCATTLTKLRGRDGVDTRNGI